MIVVVLFVFGGSVIKDREEGGGEFVCLRIRVTQLGLAPVGLGSCDAQNSGQICEGRNRRRTKINQELDSFHEGLFNLKKRLL